MSDMSNKKIGITGTIGSGKSTVTTLISEYFPTISSDDIVANLYSHEEFVKKINAEFLKIDSTKLDKNLLANLIFKDGTAKKRLENIIHPIVKEEIELFFEVNQGPKFVEVPLLFEAGFNELFDVVILVVADDEVVYQRMIDYRNYTREEVKLRIENQFPVEVKLEKSDYVIYNNKDLKSLELEVKKILKKIVSDNYVVR